MTRREFVTLLGVGTVGALLGVAAPDAAANDSADDARHEAGQWTSDVSPATSPRLYHSATHTDARMPLGGIGTGNFEIGADGQLTTWQLFNTLRDGSVPFFFGIRTGGAAKILQTAGGPPDLPHVSAVEMTGEYPLARLRFPDPDLAVHAEMTAFSPFAPLDTALSSMPVAAFVFRLHNPSKVAQTVSLAAFIQNPVGYDAMGPIRSFNSVGFNAVRPRLTNHHPNYGGNVNRVSPLGRQTLLSMHAEAGAAPTLDRSLTIYANLPVDTLNLFPVERPKSLTIAALDTLASSPAPAEPAHTLIWLEDAAAELSEESLRAAQRIVRAGATLLFSGANSSLLKAFAQATASETPFANAAPDIIFADFESDYAGWTVEGEAFGTRPATGTLPNQQRVSGFSGRGLVNSFLQGDDATGRLISAPFPIQRNFIRFLVGGGNHRSTQIRLIVDNKIVRATSGRNNEQLLPARWDVRQWRGKTAHIEIVDEQKGGWGHINIDHIEFADSPFSRALIEILEETLPARFTGVTSAAGNAPPNTAAFTGLTLREGATESVTRGGLKLISRSLGAGRVALTAGSPLGGDDPALIGARQRAYSTLTEIVGGRYTASAGVPVTAPGYGTLALAALNEGKTTDGEATNSKTTALPAFDDWKTAWNVFAAQGHFAPPDNIAPHDPTPAGKTVNGALATAVDIPAGKSVEVTFLLAWRYPNKYSEAGAWMGNHYATLWPDAAAVARDAAARFATLREKTERFRTTFYDSTLPYGLLDCVSSQISTIRHVGVTFRIANGDLYGWEGSNGCCPPTCTHVWGYEQTLAYLFPDLEKEMRRIDFRRQQLPSGGVNNRTEVPSPPHPTGEQPFSDGHASCILKAYREARNHPDDSWLKAYWPHIKKAVEYLIARDAATSGGVPDGTLSDDQWNTYDNAIHGVNSFIGTYYLAALRAGEEMARRRGDRAAAERYHSVFEKGRENLIRRCWNGEYFQQDLPDYEKRAGEYGPGCLSDQIIGQWWAHQLGLGYLLPREQVQSALHAIYKHNWLTDHTNWRHNWRPFAGGKDKGLLLCTWPKGGRPADTIPYVDEVWTGVEYQVGAHMIYEGMTEEGLTIVRGVRERYNGRPRAPIPRNPWNEIECGGHYARAMSSWSLLHALSGFEYDGPLQTLRFTPRTTPTHFKAFFVGPEGWGVLTQTRQGGIQRNEISVAEGRITVGRLRLDPPAAPKRVRLTVAGKAIAATLQNRNAEAHLLFGAPVTLRRGETLRVRLS